MKYGSSSAQSIRSTADCTDAPVAFAKQFLNNPLRSTTLRSAHPFSYMLKFNSFFGQKGSEF